MVVLNACDFRAAETTAAGDLDTLCAEAHRSADGLLHSTAEGGSLLKLERDAFRNELCIEIGVLDFNNVDNNVFSRHFENACDVELQLVDFRAAAADDNARLCAVDEDLHAVGVALDLNLRHACALKLLLQILSQLIVGYERIAEDFVLREPSRIPVLDYAHTETVGIHFLTHLFVNLLLLKLFP